MVSAMENAMLFISHMVQMKGIKKKEEGMEGIDFISHMVQMKD